MYGGESFYGTIDKVDSKWSVPFTSGRPAQGGNNRYSIPNEMFICSANFSQWVYFPISSLAGNFENAPRAVYASNWNSSAHTITWYKKSTSNLDPHIFSRNYVSDTVEENLTTVYTEANGGSWGNPNKGSLVFVRKAPLPLAGVERPPVVKF